MAALRSHQVCRQHGGYFCGTLYVRYQLCHRLHRGGRYLVPPGLHL